MDELHDQIDKLFTEVDHFDRIIRNVEDIPRDRIGLALSVAKRVRRASNLVVRSLAAQRDNQL